MPSERVARIFEKRSERTICVPLTRGSKARLEGFMFRYSRSEYSQFCRRNRRAVQAGRLCRLCMAGAAILCSLALVQAQDSATKPQADSDAAQSGSSSASTKQAPTEYVLSPDSKVSPQPSAQEYVISPEDQLEIYVLDVAELSRTYRVSQAGLIDVPLLQEPIAAAGLTTTRLSQVIAEKLKQAGMVEHPQVTAQVMTSRLHSIAIAGAVKLPQIYPTLGKTTLLDAISQAGGLVEDAGNTAIVVRGDTADRALASQTSGENPAGGEPPNPRTVKVDLKRLMETGDPSLNLALYPGDRVTVQRAGVVYVVGAVNLAGGFVLTSDRAQMTVLRAIALAQNVKSTASPEKAMIVRKNPNTPDGAEQIPLDLKKILKGREPDQKLLADDILVVPDSASRKALHRAAEAAAQAASLVIYRVP